MSHQQQELGDLLANVEFSRYTINQFMAVGK
jgi:hypothetical protein